MENSGLGVGDEVVLESNPLDLSEGSEDLKAIGTLQGRGVKVLLGEVAALKREEAGKEVVNLEPLLGRWEGVLQLRNDVPITVEFCTDQDGVRGSMTSPLEEGSRTLANIHFESPTVHFEDEASGVYDGELEGRPSPEQPCNRGGPHSSA